MNIQSIEFILFFFLVLTVYYLLPHRSRWVLLLVASYYFYYTWSPGFIFLPAALTVATYLCGFFIRKSREKEEHRPSAAPRLLLVLGLLTSVGVLVFYKYSHFILSHFTTKAAGEGLLVPVGISFFTFKAISYLTEIYRAPAGSELYRQKPGTYALYISFFPQLLAGPIDPPGKLMPQLPGKVNFRFRQVTDGLKLMLWGYFKKMLIADNLGIVVDRVYDNVHHYDNGVYFLVATVLFAFQLYCDFSGYSDIAIGAAQALGFRSIKNFDRPYHARSIGEFWRRWHISLSQWLRDYLFLPVSYALMRRTHRAKILEVKIETWAYLGGIAVTMFLGGLWHGANWTFAAWGMLMGFYLGFGFVTRKIRKRIRKGLGIKKNRWWYKGFQVCITFSLVCAGWIFFRAHSLSDAFYIFSHLHIGVGDILGGLIFRQDLSALGEIFKGLKVSFPEAAGMTLAIGVLELAHWLRGRGSVRGQLSQKPLVLRWAVYYTLLFSILYFGIRKATPFIYARF